MNVTAGDYLVPIGDSITAVGGPNEGGYSWPSGPGGFIDQVNLILTPSGPPPNQQILSVSAGIKSVSVGAIKSQVAAAPVGYRRLVTFTYGASGATSAALAGFLPAHVINELPASIVSPVVLVEIGINNALQIRDGVSTLQDFIDGLNSIVSLFTTPWPAARFIMCSCLCYQETWATGPTWAGTGLEPHIADVNTAIQAKVTALGSKAVYADWRTPLLAWEVINNPNKDASGHATVDGVHAKIATMVSIMAPPVLAAITVG